MTLIVDGLDPGFGPCEECSSEAMIGIGMYECDCEFTYLCKTHAEELIAKIREILG